ncbi:UPF0468 protein CG5343-like protein [Zychaea mexicana]|uniref:UPF0468 protein CG5343-like protein n=1 Tax=Zychaea mexicana TaxID=64656 RepID=UPI0022FDD94A|nr:UPF0468 protein CG5343-like protein [Zychaea mexicana]KAI9499313.1 UPF0468 protein CG5343-like protein [Zychaea mexicana]
MFKNTFQSGFLSIFYSLGNEPLQLWHTQLPTQSVTSNTKKSDKSGDSGDDSNNDLEDNQHESHILCVDDDLISSKVIELLSPNLSETYITCPAIMDRTLGIKLPFIVLIAKNIGKYFSFEVQVLDDKGETRRFRASNYQVATRVKPYITTMPMRLDPGWNQIVFNLADYVKRAYGTNYVETTRVTVHANCRLRRIYFTDRLYAEEELPAEFKLFLPIQRTG